jgi:hypothetical protein
MQTKKTGIRWFVLIYFNILITHKTINEIQMFALQPVFIQIVCCGNRQKEKPIWTK